MKQIYIARYKKLGGIEKAFHGYRNGTFTITDISKSTDVSTTSISNNFEAFFGRDALDLARIEHRRARQTMASLEKIDSGQHSDLSYPEYCRCLSSNEIESTSLIAKIKTILDISATTIGDPQHIWFSAHLPIKIRGTLGSIRIRYASPDESCAEFKINRNRFKITSGLSSGVSAVIFAISAKNIDSYYLIPCEYLTDIQSLNLKFYDHYNSKHASFLVKVENS